MRILITGASSGLGEALAYRYARLGVELVLLARREERLHQVAQRCETQGAHVEVCVADVSDLAQMSDVGNRFSAQSWDLLIMNAGVSLGHEGGVSTVGAFEYLMRVNLLGIHALLAPMLPTSARVVFISSLASLVSLPTSMAYSTSKRALNAYAEALRAMGCAVSVILPGFIDSEMTRKNRFHMPFFLSTEAGVDRIILAIEAKRYYSAFPRRFYLLIRIFILLPYAIQRRILDRLAPSI